MKLGVIKAKIANYAKSKNVDVQVAWDTFFFDEFIYRLSIGKYKNDFTLKGGFYLQNALFSDCENAVREIYSKIIFN